VTEEINPRTGADYEARLNDQLDAIEDAFFESRSGRLPRRGVQVVTAPDKAGAREDNHNLRRAEESLRQILTAGGLNHCSISVALRHDVPDRGIRRDQIERLAAFIIERGRGGNVEMSPIELRQRDPDLSKAVLSFSVVHLEALDGLDIAIPFSSFVPRDGRWIREAIDRKLRKYGGPAAVERITLVIGALGFIDQGQIAAFQRDCPPETLPFEEIWLVTAFHGVVPLKLAVPSGPANADAKG
jgi:hypothetical protein